MNKRGVLGEGILMMYRLAVVTFIAFVVLGVSSVFYSHYIDVRDAEAVIMTRNVVDCVAPEGVVNLSVFVGSENSILSYCGFVDKEVERFYVRVNVSNETGDVVEFSQGDSGRCGLGKFMIRGRWRLGLRSMSLVILRGFMMLLF